jgi:drug/metabolite transporter (DMT)-like permease
MLFCFDAGPGKSLLADAVERLGAPPMPVRQAEPSPARTVAQQYMRTAVMTKPQRVQTARFAAILDRPYLLLVLTPLFWGGNTVAGKLAVGQVDPYLLTIARWLGALLLIAPLALRTLPSDWPVIRRKWPLLAIYGCIGYAAFNALVYVAAHYTSAVNASIEQSLIPVLVMLANFVVFRVRSRPLQLLGVVLTMAGVGITASDGDLMRLAALQLNQGDAMVLLACIAYMVHSLALRFRPPIAWPSFLAGSFAFATVTGLGVQLMLGGGLQALGRHVAEATPLGWGIVAYAAVFPSILSQFFYARGVELVGPNRASLFINLIPVFGTLLSIVILFEPIEPYHLVTAVLVVCGILLAEFSARRPATAA